MAVGTISYDEFHGISNANSYGNRQRRGNQQRRRNQPRQYPCRARQLTPRLDLVQPGQAVALDCEGVELPNGYGLGKKGLGRVSVVNESGAVIYDTFAFYPPDVVSHAPSRKLNLGVCWHDILPENGAQALDKVLADVKGVLDVAGVVVGHAMDNDINYLRGIDFAPYEVRDTQKCSFYQTYDGKYKEKRSLKDLSKNILSWDIQGADHSSVEDSQATMRLYKLQRQQIDATQSKAARTAALASTVSGNVVVPSGGYSLSPSPDAGSTPVTTASSTLTKLTSVGHSSNPSISSGGTLLTVTTSITTASGSVKKPTVIELGRLVALPDLKFLAKGRKFDKRISRYV